MSVDIREMRIHAQIWREFGFDQTAGFYERAADEIDNLRTWLQNAEDAVKSALSEIDELRAQLIAKDNDTHTAILALRWHMRRTGENTDLVDLYFRIMGALLR